MTELLSIIRRKRMEDKLEEVLRSNEEYQNLKKVEDRYWSYLVNIGLNHVQFQRVDRYMSMMNAVNLEFAEIAYELGFRDGIQLVKEIDELEHSY